MEDQRTKEPGLPRSPHGIDRGDFVRLLSQHFGDGLVYMADEADRLLLESAIDVGLISPDGHVTAAGYRLWRRAAPD